MGDALYRYPHPEEALVAKIEFYLSVGVAFNISSTASAKTNSDMCTLKVEIKIIQLAASHQIFFNK